MLVSYNMPRLCIWRLIVNFGGETVVEFLFTCFASIARRSVRTYTALYMYLLQQYSCFISAVFVSSTDSCNFSWILLKLFRQIIGKNYCRIIFLNLGSLWTPFCASWLLSTTLVAWCIKDIKYVKYIYVKRLDAWLFLLSRRKNSVVTHLIKYLYSVVKFITGKCRTQARGKVHRSVPCYRNKFTPEFS